ncbi:LuxR C-terminal-related transcriptional regulator [Novosphingobium sp. KCTC 2891]|uniref:LuxR C-terminal-related transcriptional regulator n=1 Tax=Novosphingobium sp. KCTC 2891 TaxID=2989730 RepID=UPI0039B4AEE8|nr:LuxR C-terminal-related transcriptional regulator [Novosphingobium sp. KCTC 2891]
MRIDRTGKRRLVPAELGISAHTVKHHMKGVFGKMGIERQADLVAIVSRLS